MGGKSSGSTVTTQNTSPWVEQQPYLKEIFGQAQNNYFNAAPSYFPGSTVAQPGANTQLAWNSILGEAGQGVPTTNRTLDMLRKTAEGGYANPGNPAFSGFATGTNLPTQLLSGTATGGYLMGSPFLDAQMDNAGRKIVQQFQTAVSPQIDSNFVAGGRYGSGQHAMAKGQAQEALGNALTDAATNIYATNYQQERDRQLQSTGLLSNAMLSGAQGLSSNAQAEREMQIRGAGLVPTLEAARFMPAQMIAAVGAEQDAQAQAQLNDQIQRHNWAQQLPNNLLAEYLSLVQGNYGGSGTMTQPYYQNRGSNAIGGALSGAAAGSTFGPWGAAVGGGIGLLGSLF